MKSTLLLGVISLLSLTIYAQGPEFAWEKGVAGSSTYSYPMGKTLTGMTGEIYLLGCNVDGQKISQRIMVP